MKLLAKTLLAAGVLAALTGGAMAADLYVPPAAAPAAPAPSSSWDGPYIGASVGYSWGTATSTTSPFVMSASTTGWLVGADLGYNFHLSDQIIAGIEGNIDWANEAASVPGFGTYTVGWDGSVRGRLGLDLGQWMPYVEAGVAFANATAAGTLGSFTGTHTGWTVGAGVEVALADNLTGNLEVRYNDYGSQTYNTIPIGLTDTQVRIGLNYHF